MGLLKRGLTISPRVLAEDPSKKNGLVKSILYGSEKAKAEAPVLEAGEEELHGSTGQHSHLVGRGKYIHSVTRHSVKPSRVVEYKALIEEYYDKLAKDKQFDVKLTGSWEVVIGNLDTFYHIWEHSGFHGVDQIMAKLATSEDYAALQKELLSLVVKRETQLVQEFSFWPSSPPKQLGGIYEMRIYDLKPGSLLEWENEWRIGLEARRKFVEPIGAWFSQVGELHQVLHMWHYDVRLSSLT
ncbi:MAG: hypothetical protein CYPHOPRED_002212 [Cyphobasidiales sp. Tagirdzhanova-0007]|nr:MAG: hypothetical protein CYPHOPRED_002212 [Cyphobasidiales sp. Tagirdzhanova-0007]